MGLRIKGGMIVLIGIFLFSCQTNVYERDYVINFLEEMNFSSDNSTDFFIKPLNFIIELFENPLATITNVILNSSYNTDTTGENLTVNITFSTGDNSTFVYDWRVNNQSILLLNLGMECDFTNFSQVKDYSTWSNNGSIVTNNDTVCNRTGGYNYAVTNSSALVFNGRNSTVFVSNTPLFNLTKNITLFAMIYPQAALSNCEGIVSKSTYNVISYAFYGGAGCGGGANTLICYIGNQFLIGTKALNVNAWNSVICNYNGTSVSIYINGVLQTATKATPSISQVSTLITVGRLYGDTNNYYFNGSMDYAFISNWSFSPADLFALNNTDNLRSMFDAGLTVKYSNYSVAVTPNNGSIDANITFSNNIRIIPSNISLVSPANNTYFNYNEPIYLNWTTANDTSAAVRYHLHVDDNADYTSLSFDNSSIANNYTNVSLNDGRYYWRVLVNDGQDNSTWSETRSFVQDTVTPLIIYNLSTKGNNTYNSYRNIFVNVSITEINPDAIVFKLYNSTGIINETMFELNDTIQNMSINWSTNIFDGLYTYNVTVNDTVNHVNFTDAWNITIDTVTPLIIYNLSTKGNNTYNSYRNIFVNVSITEINPDAIVFKLYNSTGIINETMFELNDTIQNMSINWSTNIFDGLYTYNVTVNDTVNHVNFTGAWNISIHTVYPVVNITSPTSTTYSSSSVSLQGSIAANLLDSGWYTLDNGITNTSLVLDGVSFSTSLTLGNGDSVVIVYANDSVFNYVNSSNVSFSVLVSQVESAPSSSSSDGGIQIGKKSYIKWEEPVVEGEEDATFSLDKDSLNYELAPRDLLREGLTIYNNRDYIVGITVEKEGDIMDILDLDKESFVLGGKQEYNLGFSVKTGAKKGVYVGSLVLVSDNPYEINLPVVVTVDGDASILEVSLDLDRINYNIGDDLKSQITINEDADLRYFIKDLTGNVVYEGNDSVDGGSFVKLLSDLDLKEGIYVFGLEATRDGEYDSDNKLFVIEKSGFKINGLYFNILILFLLMIILFIWLRKRRVFLMKKKIKISNKIIGF